MLKVNHVIKGQYYIEITNVYRKIMLHLGSIGVDCVKK